ncbi:MAG: glycosyltransferase family 2 protein [Polaribacter sp.]|nr:glycosyltransferase family 2 protein [Polaribacter sp.]
MISALVLTYNEENILSKCLEAIDFVDEIIVFDSFSTDKTISIARSLGAKIIQRKFDNYATQRNAGLSQVNPKSKWILMVDADEIVTKELKQEIIEVVNTGSETSIYRVRRKDFFQGKWLKYSSGYPTWFPRLFKYGEVTVKREINEEYDTKGEITNLNSHLLHYPFNKGVNWWFEKHNLYSKLESEKMRIEINEPLKWSMILSSDPVTRRKFLKRFSYKLPFRPQIVFMIFFILKKGFLDGYSGYTFCRMRKVYETMIDIKFKIKKEI